MLEGLIDSNIRFLEQASALLGRVSEDEYRREGRFGLASAGAHLRHILDHYDCFLAGLSRGEIDYDARTREEAVERDPPRALEAVKAIVVRLEAAAGQPSRRVRVFMHGGTPETTGHGAASTVERELQFLVSHTVHHFALIKAVLGEAGVELDDAFGVAPSTLAYRSDTSCAR